MFGPSPDAAGREHRRDWRVPVLAGATWAGSWAGTSGDLRLFGCALAAGAAIALAGGLRRGWLLLAVGAVVVAAGAVGGVRAWATATGPIATWAREGAVVVVDARLAGGRISATGRGGPIWTADATVVGVVGRGEAWTSGAVVRLSVSGDLVREWAAVPAGATVRAAVKLGPVPVEQGASAFASARASPRMVAPPGALDVGVSAVRSGLRQAVAGLPEAPRALVPALVVGDTDLMSGNLQSQFRATGLTHLTAVSGANLTLLLAAILWAAARVGVTGWWRRGVAVVGVVAFVLLCRAEPSVLRAAAMGVVGVAALGWGGRGQGLRYLSWAVVALVLVDPWLCRSVGFVLSVCASGGIILWADRWARQLSWLPRALAEAIAVPVAAQLATQPIVTAISGQVSLAGILANLVAAPLVGPGTVLGFLAAGLSVVSPPAAAVVGWMAGGFAQALCWVAQVGSSLPGASLTWPGGPVAIGVLAACCVLVLAALPLLWRRPYLAALLGLAMVVALLRPVSAPGWPPGGWTVVSCDVGQGDATVVNAGGSSAIVVDAGPEPRLVDQCLDQLGVTEVAWLVLTHFHADHIDGVSGVASGRRVDHLLWSGVTEPAAGWRQVQEALPGVVRTVAEPGLVVAAGDARLDVVAVKPYLDSGETGADSTDQNDSSIVMRVSAGGLRVLLGGDVEEAGQSHALNSAVDLAADVLLVPHHGSAHQSPGFLAAVHASVALVSVGRNNDYGHPAARTITAVAGTGAQVFRTDQKGSIAVGRDGDQLRVTTQRSG
jgi:competence protein ComEC